ncbi:MAG: 2-oxoglutarate dehydrogenase complex dihydrolipoyllysine-residue succinyltransferase [Hoeflea sp.]|nr:2-oxoglutarate dehydrogenase complex dihydrolipoyllysine-residue succinyltransferase [Hoeflea sp.]
MVTEVRVPTLGESVSEATIGTWLKKVGDTVKVDEPLVELETDKVSIEVPSPVSGTLSEILAADGETVEVNALLAQISEGEGAAAPAKVEKAGKAEAPAKAEKPEAVAQASDSAGAATTGEAAEKTAKIAGGSEISESKMPPAPSAQKLMTENKIEAGDVAGSGKRGQVLKGDVIDALNKPAAATEAPKAARPASSGDDASREERVKMTRLRQTIARRLKEAQNTAAMLTTYNEVDMSAVMDLRSRYKELFEKKHGVKLGFMGFFTKAVTHALKEIPAVNAEIDGTDLIYKNYCHVGVAVGTDKGLVVPVVRDADQMSIAEIEKEIGRLGRAARDGELSMADMQGGTFTISNGGVYGSLMSSPILNSPQSGILGMHKIQDRPVAVGGQVVIRPMMYLALSYDHRIVDGKDAVTFLVRVKDSLEDPERLVLDL